MHRPKPRLSSSVSHGLHKTNKNQYYQLYQELGTGGCAQKAKLREVYILIFLASICVSKNVKR